MIIRINENGICMPIASAGETTENAGLQLTFEYPSTIQGIDITTRQLTLAIKRVHDTDEKNDYITVTDKSYMMPQQPEGTIATIIPQFVADGIPALKCMPVVVQLGIQTDAPTPPLPDENDYRNELLKKGFASMQINGNLFTYYNIYGEVISQADYNAICDTVQAALNLKSDKTYVDTQLGNKADKSSPLIENSLNIRSGPGGDNRVEISSRNAEYLNAEATLKVVPDQANPNVYAEFSVSRDKLQYDVDGTTHDVHTDQTNYTNNAIDTLLDTRANQTYQHVSGSNITIKDCDAGRVIDTEILGVSVQDGIPTADVKVPIKSSGDEGYVDLVACGKNLFDIAKYSGTAYYTIDFGKTYTGAKIHLKPNTKYYIKAKEKTAIAGLYMYIMSGNNIDPDTGGTRLGCIVGNGVLFAANASFTTGTDRVCLSVASALGIGDRNAKIPQIANSYEIIISEADIPYEPYQATTYRIPVTSPKRSTPDGTRDKIAEQNGVIGEVGNINQIVFDGSADESFSLISTSTNTILFSITISDMYNTGSTVVNDINCDRLQFGAIYSTDVEGIQHSYSSLYLRINKSRLTTQDVAGLKALLSSNNMLVQYRRQNPTFTPYSQDTQALIRTIKTQSNYTNFFFTNEVSPIMSCSYRENVMRFDAENLVINPLFLQGSYNWSHSKSYIKVLDQKMQITANAENGEHYAEQVFSSEIVAGHKYYLKTHVSDFVDCEMRFFAFNLNSSNVYEPWYSDIINSEQDVSMLVTPQTVYSTPRFLFRIILAKNGVTAFTGTTESGAFSKPLLVDLTATFGDLVSQFATPEQAERALFAKYAEKWFDGKQNIWSAKSEIMRYLALDNAKADKVQEEWITPTLLGGATNHVVGGVKYRKSTLGRVIFKGSLSTVALNTECMIMPAGLRPSQTVYFIANSNNGGSAYISIATSGSVIVHGAYNVNHISFDQISYEAEQ